MRSFLALAIGIHTIPEGIVVSVAPVGYYFCPSSRSHGFHFLGRVLPTSEMSRDHHPSPYGPVGGMGVMVTSLFLFA